MLQWQCLFLFVQTYERSHVVLCALWVRGVRTQVVQREKQALEHRLSRIDEQRAYIAEQYPQMLDNFKRCKELIDGSMDGLGSIPVVINGEPETRRHSPKDESGKRRGCPGRIPWLVDSHARVGVRACVCVCVCVCAFEQVSPNSHTSVEMRITINPHRAG